MATIEDLQQGLVKADAAGNTADAKAFADAIRSMAPPAATTLPNGGRGVVNPANVTPLEPQEGLLDRALHNTTDNLKTAAGLPLDIAAGLAQSAMKAGSALKINLPKSRLTEGMGNDNPGLDEAVQKQYDERGPLAGVAKMGGDIALTMQGGATKAGALAAEKLVGAGGGILKRSLARGVEGAVGGAVGGAVLTPGKDETRAGNALQGAAFGGVAGPALGALGDGALAAKDYLKSGKDAALARAESYFSKTLGKGKMDSIESNLSLPQELPMSTAAAVGRPELDSMERIARAKADVNANAKWHGLDARTNAAANTKLGSALGGDIAELQPMAQQKADILPEAQNFLDKIKLKDPDRQALANELINLKTKTTLFENDPKAIAFINNTAAQLLDPTAARTVGGLAHFETNLGDQSLNPKVIEAVRNVVRSHIDANSGGAWSAAYGIREGADAGLKNATAASNVANDFQSIYGGARGKVAPSGEAAMGSKRLENSVNKFGETKADAMGNAEDLLKPDTRHQVNDLIDALRKAEGPRAGRGGTTAGDTPWGKVALDQGGNPLPIVDNHWVNMAKVVLRKVTGDRAGATQEAADLALRSTGGWQKMLDAASKNNDIKSSDAAMLARILRGVAPAGASAVSGE